MKTWNIDTAHSEIAFIVTHMMVSKVRGNFNDFEGWIKTNGEDLEGSEVYFSVVVSSIDTRSKQRDEHLRSPEFFDVESNPKLEFKSKSFTKKSDGGYEMTGDLTIRDQTKPVVLDVEHTGEGTNASGNKFHAFEITGSISRKDFGITWNPAIEGGGVVVSDMVKFDIVIQAEDNK